MTGNTKKNIRILYISIVVLTLAFVGMCYELYNSISEDGYVTRQDAKEYNNGGWLPSVNYSDINFSTSSDIVVEVDK